MLVNSARFGRIDVAEHKVIDFNGGLPGLEHVKNTVLIAPENTAPILWLQSIEDEYVVIPVLNCFDILQDYSVEIVDAEVEHLDIRSADDLLVLNVVVIPDETSKMTVNLAAPIVINTRIGKGKQVVIDDRKKDIRYPIFADICMAIQAAEQIEDEEGDAED